MALWFQAIRYKNILSTGNAFTEIQLDKSPSTLIIGRNGEGKSTFIDAICFALYGKSFRKIKKAQLINSINNGDLVVEIDFLGHDKKQYQIRRGLKPDFFEIYQNSTMIDQEAASRDYQAYLEQHILRMNYRSFTQIVLLGSASFMPFMQLPTGMRREIIEDLLDIRVFSAMNSLLKDRTVNNRALIALKRQEIDGATNIRTVYLEQQQQEQTRSVEAIEECDNNIVSHVVKKKALEKIHAEDKAVCKGLESKLSGYDAAETNQTTVLQLLKTLRKKETKLVNDAAFFETNTSCPTCTQALPHEFCQQQAVKKQTTLVTVREGIAQLETEIVTIEQTLDAYEIAKAKLVVAGSEMDLTSGLIRDEQTAITILEKRRKELAIPTTNDHAVKIAELDTKLAEINQEHIEAINTKEVMDVATIILRDDGIKARIVKQYIAIINQLINKYLAALDFFVSFELDENFNEIMRSRYRDEFSYENFSEGEKMRIDLAILFTWRAVAKLKNSASTNLLVLDEVFDASLDAAGCEEFLKLIHTLEDCSVFVISHKGDLMVDKFKDCIKFEKIKSFSRIAA